MYSKSKIRNARLKTRREQALSAKNKVLTPSEQQPFAIASLQTSAQIHQPPVNPDVTELEAYTGGTPVQLMLSLVFLTARQINMQSRFLIASTQVAKQVRKGSYSVSAYL